MAYHISSLKRARQEAKRNAVNQQRRTRLRHQIRVMRKALASKDAKSAEAMLPKTFSLVDRAAKWGIIKTNTASRYKSRLAAGLKKLQAA
jgi:small subunit ribosomal protein S20